MKRSSTASKGAAERAGSEAAAPRLLFIDSVEAGVARLLPAPAPDPSDDDAALRSYAFPAALLPEGAREGDWIELRVQVAAPPAGAEGNAARRARLGQGDDGGDFSL